MDVKSPPPERPRSRANLTRTLGKSDSDERARQFAGVAHQIGRDIVGGTYPSGARLPSEADMLEGYAVSRTALREAYSKLSAKGLISAKPKVGTVVREQIHWNMLDPEVLSWHLQTMPAETIARDLYVLRRIVEPQACALATQMHTQDDITVIEQAFRGMVAGRASERDLVAADLRFHMAILAATKNPFIGAFSSLIHAAMLSTFELSWRGAEIIKDERLEQHQAVLEAIKNGDPDRARDRMEALLDASIRDVGEALA